jgi:hypothetical protein
MADRKVTVTADRIEHATQRDSRHCMIAEAIKGEFPRLTNISVDLQTIRYSDPRTRKRYTCLTPPMAGHALVEFDQGRPVEPFSITLKPVHVVASNAGGRKGKKGARTGGQVPRVRAAGGSNVLVEGGPSLPRGHLGGTANVKSAQTHGELAESPEGNVMLSSGRYRQYGLRQLRA